MGEQFVFFVPIAMFIGLFSFAAVAYWSINRRRERESLYHGETLRKIADAHGQQAVFDYMLEVERIRTRRLHSAYTVGGIIAACAGAGLMIFLWAVDDAHREHAYFVGLIPLFVGLGLLAYTLLAPKR
jgi:uncharacterized protein DUF6249